MPRIACVDLFCGAGGLTHGFVLEGLPVVAGIDLDPACRYPYVANNHAQFLERDISSVDATELSSLFGDADLTVLAGCAPCQPFSSYAQRYELDSKDGKWGLLYEFARLAQGAKPDVITMENVPTVAKHAVFHDFVDTLKRLGYSVWFDIVDSSKYGVPQSRRRMVLLASKYGDIKMIRPTHVKSKTVRQAIGSLCQLEAGESAPQDKLHVTSTLSEINLQRIRISTPGGTWRDWPAHLVSDCHKAKTGRTYPGVYGRMEWDKPAPTMTTQCYGFGNGRFGHPVQDRAISLREAAILQSFPLDYAFIPADGEVNFTALGRLIGNAVPVDLGRAIARSIRQHFASISAQSVPKEGSAMPQIQSSSPQASRRMARVRQKGTAPEVALRQELYRSGLRYRVNFEVLKKPRRVADLAFPGLRIAVFVDGCFWHGCPEHATWPKQNAEFWKQKIETNRQRDADTNDRLRDAGWTVLRVWEHEPPIEASKAVAQLVTAVRARLPKTATNAHKKN